MTVDYPDWTRLIQLIGSNIMLPIDIQASYVMIPVDIQAQYVTLDIDIVAQTVGNIGIDIKAASVGNIGIDIKANTLGNLTIDIEAQSVGVYYGAEWETKEGNDKFLSVVSETLESGDSAYATYTVPAGKTYYITSLSFMSLAVSSEDRDLHQTGYVYLWNQTDSTFLAHLGGDGGNGISFPSPVKVAAEKEVRLTVLNYSAHDSLMRATCGGFVI